LDKARLVFPGRHVFLFDSAYLHEKFSSLAIQAAVQELHATGTNVPVESRRNELQRAERFFRQALALAPDDAETRLRLGRTLGELGRHEEAGAELRRALDADLDSQRRYLAELFLGREEQALGRRDEAKRRYENAAELYPDAQSPRLALSQLARQSGDRAGALRALQAATSPSSDDNRLDPWWHYYHRHLQEAAAVTELMDQMRTILSAEPR
jgi:tetratricopeptide (TPR) repeat protein